MDKVEKVSIGGYAFTLEESACRAAQAYLSELEQFYGARGEGREIMEGIEERFAELLLEKVPAGSVAQRHHIEGVIAVLGRPDELERETEATETFENKEEKPRRRLYRDVSNKMVGGVCSGLAAYFNLDVAVVRIAAAVLLFVTLFSGFNHTPPIVSLSAVLAYLVLWICVPAARTVQQRCELRGEKGTADEVRKNVESGLREMGDFAGNVARSTTAHRLGRAFLVVLGMVFLAVGVSGLCVLGIGAFSRSFFGLGELYGEGMRYLNEISPAFDMAMSTSWAKILLLLALGLPFIGFLYAGLQLIFNFRVPSWHPGLVIFILWLIVIIILCVVAIACSLSDGSILFT